MVGFEKALGAVKVIKDQIQYRSQSLLNLARDYFSKCDVFSYDEMPHGYILKAFDVTLNCGYF